MLTRKQFEDMLVTDKAKAIRYLVKIAAEKIVGGDWKIQVIMALQTGDALPMCKWTRPGLLRQYDSLHPETRHET